MAQDYNDIPAGLRIPAQIPLNVKEFVADEATLGYLGLNNNLAFTYYEGIKIKCIAEDNVYEWREVESGEENTGLVPLDFTYPIPWIVFGITYSGREFNFFQVTEQTGPPGTDATISIGDVNTGAAGTDVIITNSGTSSAAEFNFTIPRGDKGDKGDEGDPGQDLISNLQKVITGNYSLSNIDNNYTIFINNGSTAINITVPAGLQANIEIGFIQQGSGNVTFVQSGTTINSVTSMKKIKGQNYQAFLIQLTNTNTYHLLGNLKT